MSVSLSVVHYSASLCDDKFDSGCIL